MNTDTQRTGSGVPRTDTPTRGLRLGSIFGVDVYLDGSLLIIFALVTLTLSAGLLPFWHPDWGATLRLLTAAAAAVLFIASILIHELSHALVGRRVGVEVRRITLFVFGGMAQMEGEPTNWRAELAMAIAGPITSLLLGLTCLWLAGLLAGPLQLDTDDPRQTLSQLGPFATLLFWLGPVNILLGLFNLVPGFPLDGGRVLRALLWGATGDLTQATRWAATAGQAFAWLLIATGFGMILGLKVPFFGSGPIGGLWLALIGWFLNNAAVMSYRQRVIEASLGDLPVSRVMQTDFHTVRPQLTVEAMVEGSLLTSGQRAFPVEGGGVLLGLVCLDDVRRLDREEWPERRVAEIMTPADRLHTLTPSEPASRALERLARHGVNQLPVVQDGRVLGLVTRQGIITWLALRRGAAPD